MIFAMQQLPGEFTTFDFIPGVPAPFNFALAILRNQKMLSLLEKLQTAPALLPMLVQGERMSPHCLVFCVYFVEGAVKSKNMFAVSSCAQLLKCLLISGPIHPHCISSSTGQSFIDAQDELSVTEFMRKYGMPERINEEVFVAMAKALDFIDPGER